MLVGCSKAGWHGGFAVVYVPTLSAVIAFSHVRDAAGVGMFQSADTTFLEGSVGLFALLISRFHTFFHNAHFLCWSGEFCDWHHLCSIGFPAGFTHFNSFPRCSFRYCVSRAA